jgi:alkylation response protein AidB-like acyl-CoA dehydrogenase
MFFPLSDEQREIQAAVRDFAQSEIAPHAERWDEEHYFPRELFRPMAAMGLAGLLAPEELGGAQLSRLTGALIYEEIGHADMSAGVWLAVHNMVTGLIARFGDDEQRGRWVPRMAAGELLGAFALSEAHAGSDAANVRCAARRNGDDYSVNGAKYWVTSAGVADVYVVFVRTDPTERTRGISALVVERDTPGFRIGKLERKMGCTPARPASCSSRTAACRSPIVWGARATASRSRSPRWTGDVSTSVQSAPAWRRRRSTWRRATRRSGRPSAGPSVASRASSSCWRTWR